MRDRLLPLLAAIALAGFLSGCGASHSVTAPTPGSSTDQALVTSVVAAEPELADEDQFQAQDAADLAAPPAGALAAIQPLRFWRVVDRVDRSFEFAFADTDSTGRPTRALVTVHKRLLGRFVIVAATATDPPDTTVVRKPLDDRWIRRVELRRFTSAPLWRIVGTSSVRITAKDAATRIVSLRVQGAGLDTTVTEPLQVFSLRRILALQPGTALTLTATTLRNDDVVVLCRAGQRRMFHNNGDNTYTGTWLVPDPGFVGCPMPGRPPVFHVGVDALSHGTLFDAAAPYDSQAWILPVRLAPEPIADTVP